MIKVNDILPDVRVRYGQAPKDTGACAIPQVATTHQLFKGKKAVLFAVPGAFSQTCHAHHVPSFIDNYDKLREKGVDLIACIATNDAFVMYEWGKQLGVQDKIQMLSDGNAELITQIGLTLDSTSTGMGLRSQRFAILLDDLKVAYVGVDKVDVADSGAEAILARL